MPRGHRAAVPAGHAVSGPVPVDDFLHAVGDGMADGAGLGRGAENLAALLVERSRSRDVEAQLADAAVIALGSRADADALGGDTLVLTHVGNHAQHAGRDTGRQHIGGAGHLSLASESRRNIRRELSLTGGVGRVAAHAALVNCRCSVGFHSA